MLKYQWDRGVNTNTNKCRGKNGEKKKKYCTQQYQQQQKP